MERVKIWLRMYHSRFFMFVYMYIFSLKHPGSQVPEMKIPVFKNLGFCQIQSHFGSCLFRFKVTFYDFIYSLKDLNFEAIYLLGANKFDLRLFLFCGTNERIFQYDLRVYLLTSADLRKTLLSQVYIHSSFKRPT